MAGKAKLVRPATDAEELLVRTHQQLLTFPREKERVTGPPISHRP